jgi:hypothetical protein
MVCGDVLTKPLERMPVRVGGVVTLETGSFVRASMVR